MACVWVRWKCGKVSSALLTREDGSTSELRGVPMWRLLNELSQQWLPTRKLPRRYQQTSLDFERTAKWHADEDGKLHGAGTTGTGSNGPPRA